MKNNAPEIRFAGFSEDWEERTLESLVDRVKSYSLSRGVETSEYTGYKYIHYGDIHTKVADVIDEESILPNIKEGKYELLQKGDLVLADASEDYQGIATPAVITCNTAYKLVAGLHTIVLRPNNASPLFLYYLFNSSIFKKYGYKAGTGMKVFGISFTNLVKFKSLFPLPEEQTQIGNFFKQLDDTIALHQCELDHLKQTKQGFLQKMFPQEGEAVAEIRFSGFSGDWEWRKLGDLFSERNERSDNGELISVTINSGVIKASSLERKDNSSQDKSNYKKVELGDIAYNSMRMWQGASGVSNYTGILSPAYTVITPKKGVFANFFAYLFKLNYVIQIFQANSQGLTSDTWNLKFPLLKEIKIPVPNEKEQIVIANFFKRLDDTIALHELELETLKQTKKAFLQKMFV